MGNRSLIIISLFVAGCNYSKPEISELLIGNQWECNYRNAIVDVTVNTKYFENGSFQGNSIVKTKIDDSENTADVEITLSGTWQASKNELIQKTKQTKVTALNDLGVQTLEVIENSLSEVVNTEVTKINVINNEKYIEINEDVTTTCLRKDNV